MTNLIATVILTVSTNWTDQIHDGKQLGYQVTNHIATMVYNSKTNVFQLQQDTGPFIWGDTRKEIGLNVFGKKNTWYYITNGGFDHQTEYRDGKWIGSSQWGGLIK